MSDLKIITRWILLPVGIVLPYLAVNNGEDDLALFWSISAAEDFINQ